MSTSPESPAARRGSVVVEAQGNTVRIIMDFDDPDDAMLIHDQAVDGARRGELRISLVTGERVYEQ